MSGGSDASLLSYLAERLSSRIPDRVTASQLLGWLESWPWVVILDGLDEIASSRVRATVESRLNDFLIDAAAVDADLMVVATTRPQGYLEEFNPTAFETVKLRSLRPAEAEKYARQLNLIRHSGDPDFENTLNSAVSHAVNDRATAKLMRSPLQVTIMSLLLERRQRVPSTRFQLFDAYFETIYAREVAKPGALAELLDREKPSVEYIHQIVALRLHSRSELRVGVEAHIDDTELLEIASKRMLAEGKDERTAEDMASKLVRAAKHRLVLLVPVGEDSELGFELRSLQEYMSARALTTAGDDEVSENLVELAASAHWRNTWLLAVGRLFRERERMRSGILGSLQEVDTVSVLAALVRPSSLLCLDMLDDDIAAQSPTFLRPIVKQALQLLDGPPGPPIPRLAATLLPIARADVQSLEIIGATIRRGLAATDHRLYSAILFLGAWGSQTGRLTENARRDVLNTVRTLETAGKQIVANLALTYKVDCLRRATGGTSPNVGSQDDDVSAIVLEGLQRSVSDAPAERASVRIVDAMRQKDGRIRVTASSLRAMSAKLTGSDAAYLQELLFRSSQSLNNADYVLASRIQQGVEQWYSQRPTQFKPDDE